MIKTEKKKETDVNWKANRIRQLDEDRKKGEHREGAFDNPNDPRIDI